MIKFPDKPEGCFWRIRKEGQEWYEKSNDRVLRVELCLRETYMGFDVKTFGPFELKKEVEKKSNTVVWSMEVPFDKPFYTYSLDYLEATIEVAVKKKYGEYIHQLTIEKELLGDYE